VGIWVDSFMIPRDAENVGNALAYINYTLEPEVAAKNGSYVTYAPASRPEVSNLLMLASLCGAGAPEEIAARAIPLPPGIYTPQFPEEELICYADKFYSKTKLGQRKALERVRSGFSKHGEAALARFDALHQKYGL